MRTAALSVMVAGVLGMACGQKEGASGPGVDTSKATGGTAGSRSGGSGGTRAGTGGASGETGSGGSPGSAGSSSGGSDDAATGPDDAVSADVPGTSDAGGAEIDAGASDSGAASDGAGAGGPALGFYEAEAVMPGGPNEILAPAIVGGCGATNPVCGAPDTIKPEAMCCSQGKEVRQLLRGRGGLQFNKISAPTDGMYDVTWWYHCGLNDNFGDPGCGGEPNHPKAGCRPHILTVNGARLPKIYEFHCFPGPWGQIHAVTTALPLKAGGDNSIRVVATTGRDAADLDAIAIFPVGKGVPPVAFAH